MYALVKDGQVKQYPFDQSDLQKLHPNASVPAVWTEEFMASEGIVVVVSTGQPEFNPASEAVEQDGIIFNSQKNRWETHWFVRQLSPSEADAVLQRQWSSIRADRNTLLSGCDWTQLTDVPLSEEKKADWVVYRQALRDVTNQTDPFDIVWPVQPA